MSVTDQPAGPQASTVPDPDGVAPGEDELRAVLSAVAGVPDHGSLRPWRLVVIQGAERERFGAALAGDLAAARPESGTAALERVAAKARKAPVLVAIVESPVPGTRIPLWEQQVSAACTGYALVHAARAAGWGAVWKSAAVLEGPAVSRYAGLSTHERLLGWVLIGPATAPGRERDPATVRALLAEKVTWRGAPGA